MSQTAIVGKSKQLPSMYLTALRFLWTFLVADTTPGGAIFSHGIGFPRYHLLMLFARLYCTTFADVDGADERKKVLIITTESSMSLWVRVGQGLSVPQFKVCALSTAATLETTENAEQIILPRQADEIAKWQSQGGCLLYTSPSPRDQRGSRMPSSA